MQNWVEVAQSSANRELLAVWQDFRAGRYNIYGQRVSTQPLILTPTATATRTATPTRTATQSPTPPPPTPTGTAQSPTATATPPESVCCQCAASCAAPVNDSCGECTLVVGAVCRAGALCELQTPTPSPEMTPTATRTPSEDDCCQCEDFCAAPVVGTCGGCVFVPGASCTGGTLCVLRTPASPSPTPTPIPCVGDCRGTGQVTVDGLITLVNIALGNFGAESCPHGNPGGGQVTIDVLIKAVNNALEGCPGA